MTRRLLVALVTLVATLGVADRQRPAAAAGPSVLLLGDSVMAAFNFSYGAGGVSAIASGYSPVLQAAVCRRLTTAGCLSGGTPASALSVLQSYRGRLPRLVVVSVGHNESDAMAGKIDAILREATASGATAVVWLTYQKVSSSTAYASNNAALWAATARWPQLHVADWRAASAGRTSWFSSDGVHLTGSGATAYGQLIRAHLDRVAAPDPRCVAANAIGTPVASAAPPAVAPGPPGRVVAVSPVRLADTRSGWPGSGPARLGAGRALELQVAGTAGVPADAVGAVVNLTVIAPCTAGFAVAYPGGSADPPTASSANFRAGEVVAATAMVRLGPGGTLAVSSSAQTDLAVDLVAYVRPSSGAGLTPIDQARLLDTRPAAVAGGGEVAVAVRGGAGGALPASGMTGVVLNLTAARAAADGYLTAYPGPCGTGSRPYASTLNVARGATVANLVVVPVGADGTVCVATSGGAEVIVDALGWLGAGGDGFVGVTPVRLADTRPGAPALAPAKGRLVPGAVLAVPVAPGGVPAGASAVAVTVTAVAPTAGGWLVAWPCGRAQPPSSNVNVAAGENRPNLAVVAVGAGGQVCVASSTPTDVLVDLAGWFT